MRTHLRIGFKNIKSSSTTRRILIDADLLKEHQHALYVRHVRFVGHRQVVHRAQHKTIHAVLLPDIAESIALLQGKFENGNDNEEL